MTEHFRPFAHVTAEKAAGYRAVMQTFAAARMRFLVHLRPEDVADALRDQVGPHELPALLALLVEWGNLRRPGHQPGPRSRTSCAPGTSTP